MRRIDVETSKFALLLRGINVQRDARDRVFVDFEDVVVGQVLFDIGARPADDPGA